MKTFKALFFLREKNGELKNEVLEIAASNKKEAIRTAKLEAAKREWRFAELITQ